MSDMKISGRIAPALFTGVLYRVLPGQGRQGRIDDTVVLRTGLDRNSLHILKGVELSLSRLDMENDGVGRRKFRQVLKQRNGM